MDNIFISAGSTIYVSTGSPINKTVDEFSALTYTQIRGIRAVGDLGTINETYQCRPLYGKPYNKSVGKGVQSITFELYKNISDAGQSLLRGLCNTRFEYSFKVIDSANEISYFTATSSQNAAGIGNGSAIMDNRIALDLTSEVVKV